MNLLECPPHQLDVFTDKLYDLFCIIVFELRNLIVHGFVGLKMQGAFNWMNRAIFIAFMIVYSMKS
jgi:hypothetical protein